MLEEKGVPQPRIVLPAAVIAVLLVILLLVLPALAPADVSVQFTLQDSTGQAVPNAALTLLAGQKSFDAHSDASGQVAFNGVPTGQKLQLQINAPGYSPTTQRLDYGDKTVILSALPAATSIAFSAQVLD